MALDIEKVFTGPGQTNLAKGEIITSFFIPKRDPNTGAAYLKLGRRGGGGDCALVGIAARLTMNKEIIPIENFN
jgi:CO/xanthine dehydrogenase FAD-binding subunit